MVTGTRFILLTEITKIQTQHIKQWFSRHWASMNRIVFPGKWKTNEVSPMITLTYCLEKVQRPLNREKIFRQSLVVSLSWTDEAGNSRMPKQLKFSGWTTRRESSIEREFWESAGFLLYYSDEYGSAHSCEETIQVKNHTEGLEGILCRAYTGPGILHIPSTRKESFIIYGEWWILRRDLPWEWRKIKPLPNKHSPCPA